MNLLAYLLISLNFNLLINAFSVKIQIQKMIVNALKITIIIYQ